VPLGDGAPLRAAIAAIHSGGNTHLHGGWREGAETLADVAGTGLKRVILLSDGQANEGLTDAAAIAAQCAEWAARGVTTSTYGLRDLRLSAAVPDGVEVQMVNNLPPVEGGWRLPDLAWGAEAWAVLRLKVPAGALPPLGQLLSVLRVSVEGRSLEGDAVTLERAGLALPVMPASAFDKLTDDELVSRRLVELAAADALSRMRTAADHGDWGAVDRLLEEASRQFAGNEWVAAVLAAMKEIAESRSRERMMKESMYSASKLRSRLSAKDEDVSFSVASESIERPAYLRRKPSQGKGDV
jgi:Ca-activated chloride channel family protein